MSEIGHELFSVKMFSVSVSDIVFSEPLRRAAVCGEENIKILDTKNWRVRFYYFSLNAPISDRHR